MSGLHIIFRDFLPDSCSEHLNRSPQYNDSICFHDRNQTCMNTTSTERRGNSIDHFAEADIKYEDKSKNFTQTSYDSPVGWKEWNEHQILVQAKYLNYRLGCKEEIVTFSNDVPRRVRRLGDRDIVEEFSDANLNHLSGADGSDHIETKTQQEINVRDQNIFYSVPLCSDAILAAECLADIDLRCKSLSLSLIVVGKLWQLRSIQRQSCVGAPARKHCFYYHGSHRSMSPTLVRSPYQFCQYDGPLHTCYQQVLSLELIDTFELITSNQLHEGHINMQPNKRIMVFFYNEYAVAVNSIIQKAQVQTRKRKSNELSAPCDAGKLLFSFKNIPCKCIFPFPVSDWYDREDMCQFCLCIGNQSCLPEPSCNESSIDGGHSQRHIRFDCKEMIVYAAAEDAATGEITEYQIKPSVKTPSGIELKIVSRDESVIIKRYAAYKSNVDSRTLPLQLKEYTSQNQVEESNHGTHRPNFVEPSTVCNLVDNHPKTKESYDSNRPYVDNVLSRVQPPTTSDFIAHRRPASVFTLLVRHTSCFLNTLNKL